MTTYREKSGPPYNLNSEGAAYVNQFLVSHKITARKGQAVEVSAVQGANLPNSIDLYRTEWPQRIAVGQDQNFFQ